MLDKPSEQDHGKTSKKSADRYMPFKNELSVIEGHVLKGTRLVVPAKLRTKLLHLDHERHPGETAMIRRLRDRVWWPSMDTNIRDYVKRCEGCALMGKPSAPEPMKRREMPQRPWVDMRRTSMAQLVRPGNTYWYWCATHS